MAVTPIPLAWRLPNPPPLLVGREAEVQALGVAVRQGAVTVVAGPAGVGKTTLLLWGLHKSLPRRVDSMRYVRLGAERPAETLLLALTAGEALRRDDWASLLGDSDALRAAALDQAESKEAWMVVDAGPDTDPVQLDAWIETISRHARRSHWIVATRQTPHETEYLRGQIVPVGALAPEDLHTLARKLAPEADEVWLEAALTAAGGSPGWLRHALSLERAVGADPRLLRARLREGLLASLAPEVREAVEALAVAEVPVPRATLHRTPATTHEALAAAGLVDEWPGGNVSVSPILRAQLAAVATGEHWRAAAGALADALAACPTPLTPPQSVESIRLWITAGRPEAACARLDAVGDALLDAGYARRLWSLLEPHTEPALARWRLRAAVEATAVTASRELLAPVDPEPRVQLDWVRYLASRGELAAAERLAHRLAEEVADRDPVLASEAQTQAARCAMNEGRYADALAGLESLPAPDLVAQSFRLTCRAVLGHTEALGEARALLEVALRRPAAETVRARLTIATLFYRLGRLREAGHAFDTLLRDEASAPLALRRPDLSFVQFAVRLALGQLDEAGATLDRLRPLLGTESLFGLSAEFGVAALRLARGELDGLEAELLRIEARARDRGRPDLPCFSRSLNAEVSRMRATPLPETDDTPPVRVPYYTDLEQLQFARRRARGGQTFAAPPSSEHADCRMLAHIVAADAALAAGAPAQASAAAGAALELAREHGLALREADALELMADADLAAGAVASAASAVADLAALGRTMPSPRFAADAELRAVLLATRPDWAALERLAGQGHAPGAARRARALLGDRTVPLDRVDRAVLDAVQARPHWGVPEGPDGPWQPGWGLDVPTSRAWLPDGRWVELQTKPQLWRLLLTLARAGESGCDKEVLLRAVWGETDYHPLRHDNRLQATVRNLRLALGDDDLPTRVLTLTDGYRVAGALRRAGDDFQGPLTD
jgi:tetratricopeptide (TPR) repeat protein